ncbi:hypothetical protein Neosp_011305 [[Neocosmospora] mangrovei]
MVVSEVLQKLLERLALDELRFAIISPLDLTDFLGASIRRSSVNIANNEKSADLSGNTDADTREDDDLTLASLEGICCIDSDVGEGGEIRRLLFEYVLQFNILNDVQTSLTESAVQEIFWVVEDRDEIRSIEVKGRFIKTSSSGVYFLVMKVDAEFMEKYKFTIPRVTREGADVNVFFNLLPPPATKGTKDNMFLKAVVAPIHIPEQPHDGNLVLKVREPLEYHAPTGFVEVKSFASYSGGEEQ